MIQDTVAFVIASLLDDKAITTYCSDRVTPGATDKQDLVGDATIVVERIDIQVQSGLQTKVLLFESVRLALFARSYQVLSDVGSAVIRVLRSIDSPALGQTEAYEAELETHVRLLDFRVPVMR